jgi:ROS/MUCR transcriptional regulator protein
MTLEIAINGPCDGHLCDACNVCRKGRCCKKDNPHYKLPVIDDWDGPVYGDRGVLIRDDESVECHACGKSYKSLQTHARNTHGLDAREYKSIFGLMESTPLVCERISRGMRSVAQQLMRENYDRIVAQLTISRPTPEQASDMQRNRRKSIEEVEKRRTTDWNKKISVNSRKWREANPERIAEINRSLQVREERHCDVCGKSYHVTPSSKKRHCGANVCRATLRHRADEATAQRNKLRSTHEKREFAMRAAQTRMQHYTNEEWGAIISQARGWPGGFACIVCHRWTETPRWTKRKTCSDACFRENNRRRIRESPPTFSADTRARISAKATERAKHAIRNAQGRFTGD